MNQVYWITNRNLKELFEPTMAYLKCAAGYSTFRVQNKSPNYFSTLLKISIGIWVNKCSKVPECYTNYQGHETGAVFKLPTQEDLKK